MEKRKLLIVLLLLCVSIMLISGYRVFKQMREYELGDRSYENMKMYANHDAEPETETTPQDGADPPVSKETEKIELVPAVDFTALQAVYPSVVAWVNIEGTGIDYPVVQAGDNDYFLKRLPDGTWNSSGSIFMDYRNSADLLDWHTIIYGHNMRNNAMFAELMSYKDQAFYDEHPVIMLHTPAGSYLVEIFAGYVCTEASDAWKMDFTGTEDFIQWCESVIGRSCFESGVAPERHDSVVTLSTCSYEFDEARFVVHGILRENTE